MKPFAISNKTYDMLKYIALIAMPSLATLYTVLSEIWGWPYGKEIPATITAIDVFLGSMLCISSANYRADSTEEVTK